MLGDFNADDAHLGRLGQIPGITPLIRGVFTNTRQNRLYDNIIIHQPSTHRVRRPRGVFDVRAARSTLRSRQAEQVSDHFPVWAEFSVYERDYAGRIASRRGTVRRNQPSPIVTSRSARHRARPHAMRADPGLPRRRRRSDARSLALTCDLSFIPGHNRDAIFLQIFLLKMSHRFA